MPRVALVTCREIPEPDHDQELLLDAIRGAGLQAEMLAWDDPGGDPGVFDLCVLRSCWNYYEDPDAFLAWCLRAATSSRLLNDVEVIQWNLHKGYLRQLEDTGIPIVPTVWFERGEQVDLRETMLARGWDDIVIKPAVSASSFGTRRYPVGQLAEAQRFLDAVLAERDTMVQRYMSTVELAGERAIVWIDGRVTHAVVKSPRFADGAERVSDPVGVSGEERAAVISVLSRVKEPLLYARVDLVPADGGKSLLSELELMEPSLFLKQCPEALERFVAAIRRECGATL
jgi:hypothetical protein